MVAYDDAGPTPERLQHAGEFHTASGRSRATTRYTMLDDALGRAWMRRKLSDAEYYALRRYALHWLAGGLQGHLGSIDLNRILAHDPGAMSGLAKTERQADHRLAYHEARHQIGTRPALVADGVACFDLGLVEVGVLLGYRSAAHARVEACRILCDAGYRLGQFWKERDR
jgi:hypothetical protein